MAAYAFCIAKVQLLLGRLKYSDVTRRLARGAFWLMAGATISRCLMLVASIFVARIIGKIQYGELGIVQSTVGMFGTFAGFGLGITATRYVAACHRTDPDRVGRIIALSGIVAMVTGALMALSLMLSASWLALHTLNAPELTGVLRIGALMLFLSAINGAQTGALAGFESFKRVALTDVCVGVVSFAILVSGALVGGLIGATWALVINLAASCLLSALMLRATLKEKHIVVARRGCGRELPMLWHFSLPALLAGLMVGPVQWVCSTLLVNRAGGYSEMAILSVANQWYMVIMFFPSVLAQVVLPVLAERLGQREKTQSTAIMVLTVKATAAVVLPVVLVTSFASPFIMRLYGESFRNGWPTLVVVLMTTGLVAVLTPVGQVIAASGRMWVGVMMNVGWAAIVVVATVALVDKGALGLAFARAIGYVIHGAWTFAFAIWLIKRKERVRAF